MKAESLNLTEVKKVLGNWYVYTIDNECHRVKNAKNIDSVRREIEAETIDRLNARANELGDELTREEIETARNIVDMNGNKVKFNF